MKVHRDGGWWMGQVLPLGSHSLELASYSGLKRLALVQYAGYKQTELLPCLSPWNGSILGRCGEMLQVCADVGVTPWSVCLTCCEPPLISLKKDKAAMLFCHWYAGPTSDCFLYCLLCSLCRIHPCWITSLTHSPLLTISYEVKHAGYMLMLILVTFCPHANIINIRITQITS